MKDDHTHCPCNGVWMCATCHSWAHAHPEVAQAAGFIVSRAMSEPGLVPVVTWYGDITLRCDGDIAFVIGGINGNA